MANVLTRAAAAKEKLLASRPMPTRRSKRIRDMKEANKTEVPEALKPVKRNASKRSPEGGRKGARAGATNGIMKSSSKSSKSRSAHAKMAEATRVLKAVGDTQRFRSEEEQSSPEMISTQPSPSEPLNSSGGQASDRSPEEQTDRETNANSSGPHLPEARMTDRHSIPGGPYAALLAARRTNADGERLTSHAARVYAEMMREGLPELLEARRREPDYVPGGRYALNLGKRRTGGYQSSARSREEQVNYETDAESRGSSLQAARTTYPDSNVRNRYAPSTADRIADLDLARNRRNPRMLPETMRADFSIPHSYSRHDEPSLDTRPEHPIRSNKRVFNDAFPGALSSAVSTQRALRQKRIKLQESQRDVHEVRFVAHIYKKGTTRNPTTEHEWRINQVIQEKLTDLEIKLAARQAVDSKICSQVQYLKQRADKATRRLQACPSPSPENPRLRCLADDSDFWETFEKCQATAKSLADVHFELEQSKSDKDAIDDALDRNSEQSLDFGGGGPGSLSTPSNMDEDEQHMAEIPGLIQKLEDLEQRKQAAEASNGEQWAQLVKLAEDALVKAQVINPLVYVETDEGNHKSLSSVPDHLKAPVPEDAEEDVNPEGDMSAEDVLREELRVAKEVCRKAREDFEGARDLTRAEIQQLPQPVTEDDLGVARFQKLCRLTQAFRESEDVYLEVRLRAQHAGLTHPTEQLYDFEDRSDDGYAVSEVDRAADERREQVLRMHYWNGLDLESASSVSPEVGWTAGKELQALPDVRVGEDNFEGTEAVGRTRERIDVMAAITESLRGQGDIPMPDRDEIITTPEEEVEEL